jgi:hypothetical protein
MKTRTKLVLAIIFISLGSFKPLLSSEKRQRVSVQKKQRDLGEAVPEIAGNPEVGESRPTQKRQRVSRSVYLGEGNDTDSDPLIAGVFEVDESDPDHFSFSRCSVVHEQSFKFGLSLRAGNSGHIDRLELSKFSKTSSKPGIDEALFLPTIIDQTVLAYAEGLFGIIGRSDGINNLSGNTLSKLKTLQASLASVLPAMSTTDSSDPI